MVRETRHLWVGNLPENIREEEIVKHFTRYGRVESVKILPKRSQEGGRAAFVDFVDIRSATKAHEAVNRIGDREMRTDYNEPGSAGNISRLHGHTDPPARTTSNSAPGSPVQRRRFDRRTEGSASDGRYSGRPQTFYPDGYSDDEGAAPRAPSGGGSVSSTNRARPRNSRDHRRQPYSHGQEPRRTTHKPEAYRDQDPSPDHSSGSESGSESSHSRSQSPSSSGSSSSEEEEGSRTESVHAPAPSSEAPQSRTSALCLRNISLRSGGGNQSSLFYVLDSSVRDGLYHEFKKHGDVSRIFVNGQGSSRYAIVHFRRPEDAERGLEACRGKMFLGAEMDLQYWHDDRYDGSDHPPRHRSHGSSMVDDDFDPGCTRTLFVGNIEKTTTFSDLKEAFERYGEIVDVDIKKQAGNNPYAFIQFVELNSAIQARRRMDREFVGRNRVKVGFGKVSPINTIWVGGLNGLNDQQIERHFSRYGRVTRVVVNRAREQSLVSFDSVESASIAQGEMKGRSMFGRRVRVEFVSRDSRQLFFDALGRSAPSDGSSGSSSRRYEPSSPRSRGRGGGSGYYDNRWDRGRGGRGNTRRDMSSHRPWHRGGGEYEYSEGSGYHQRGHVRYRGSYEGAGYESDDYDQELRDYNYSRQREREKEQGRQRHERGGRDRDREDGNYSGNERFYPDNQERWREDRSSSGSYEESRDRKDARPRDFNDEHDRERPGYSEDDDRASLHSKPANRDIEQDEKRTKRKEKRRRKPRSPTPEGEAADSKEVLSDGEEADERKILDEKKPRKGRSGEAEIVTKGKEAETVERVRDERRLEGNGTKDADVVVKDGEKELAPASTPPEKGIKKKEKKDAKKRRKHKRIRGSLGEEEEERELEEETARMEEAAGKEAAADMVIPVSKSRVSVDTDSQRLESRETDENIRLDRPEFENQKPPRRHSSEERLLKEEREFSRDAGSRSPRKSHRDERRRDWEKTDVVRPKRRRTSDGESPPPPPPPPPPPREAVEGFPPADVLPRVALVPDGLPTQMVRPPYDVTPAPPVRYEPQLYDGNRAVSVVASPATLSPVPPAGIPLNPAVVVPPNVSTPPLAVHSPGVPIGVPAVPSLASPQGLPPPPPPHPDYNTPPPVAQQSNADTLLDLLRRYPVVWQGLLALKNDSAAVQMHYLAGNGRLAEVSLPQAPANGIGSVPPPIRIAQRMKLEPSQLEGVIRRMQSDKDHCLLLALPCGRDPLDVHAQTRALKSGFINYLQQKQAAGIINVARPGSVQPSYVLHIFPPCDFAQEHLARVSPDLLDSAADSGHLMVVVASV